MLKQLTILHFLKISLSSLILFNYTSNYAYSQQADTTQTVTLQDTVEISSDTSLNFNMILLSTSYLNNQLKYTDSSSPSVSSIITDLSLYHYKGYWAGITYTKYFGASTNTYETDLKVGYDKTFSEILNTQASYTFHRFSGDASFQGIDYKHQFQAGVGLAYKFANVTLSNYYLFTEKTNTFMDIKPGLSFDKSELFSPNDYFSFSPTVSFSLGTDYWIYNNMSDFTKTLIINYVTKKGYATNEFSYLGTDILIPVSYTYNSLTFSFSYMYNIPAKKFKLFEWENQSGFMFSFTYSPIFFL